MFDIGALVGRMKLNRAGFSTGLKQAESGLKGFASRGRAWLKPLAIGFAAVTAAVGGVVAALVGVTKTTADYGDEIGKLSKRTGESAETLSSLAYHLSKSDASVQDLQAAYRSLAKQQYNAMHGSKEARAAFKELGVEFRDLEGNARAPIKMILEIGEAVHTASDTTAAEGAAAALVRNWLKLAPAMRGGSKAIKAGMADAKRLGLAIDDEFTRNAENFNDSLSDIKGALAGVVYAIGGRLIPKLTGTNKSIAELIASNRELIAEKVADWIEKTATSMGKLMNSLGGAEGIMAGAKDLIQTLGTAGGYLVKVFGTFKALVLGVEIGLVKMGNAWKWNARMGKDEIAAMNTQLEYLNRQAADAMSFSLFPESWGSARNEISANMEIDLKREFEVTIKDQTGDAAKEVGLRVGSMVEEAYRKAQLRDGKVVKGAVSRAIDQSLMGGSGGAR